MDYNRLLELVGRFFDKAGTRLHKKGEHYSSKGSPSFLLLDDSRRSYYILEIGLYPDIPVVDEPLNNEINLYAKAINVEATIVRTFSLLGKDILHSLSHPIGDPDLDSTYSQKSAVVVSDDLSKKMADFLIDVGVGFQKVPLKGVFTIFFFNQEQTETVSKYYVNNIQNLNNSSKKPQLTPEGTLPGADLVYPDMNKAVKTVPWKPYSTEMEFTDQAIPEATALDGSAVIGNLPTVADTAVSSSENIAIVTELLPIIPKAENPTVSEEINIKDLHINSIEDQDDAGDLSEFVNNQYKQFSTEDNDKLVSDTMGAKISYPIFTDDNDDDTEYIEEKPYSDFSTKDNQDLVVNTLTEPVTYPDFSATAVAGITVDSVVETATTIDDVEEKKREILKKLEDMKKTMSETFGPVDAKIDPILTEIVVKDKEIPPVQDFESSKTKSAQSVESYAEYPELNKVSYVAESKVEEVTDTNIPNSNSETSKPEKHSAGDLVGSMFGKICHNIWSFLVYLPSYLLYVATRKKVPYFLLYWIGAIVAAFGLYKIPLHMITAPFVNFFTSSNNNMMEQYFEAVAKMDFAAIIPSVGEPNAMMFSALTGMISLLSIVNGQILAFINSDYYLQYAIACGFLLAAIPVSRRFGRRMINFILMFYAFYTALFGVSVNLLEIRIAELSVVTDAFFMSHTAPLLVVIFLINVASMVVPAFVASKTCQHIGKDW